MKGVVEIEAVVKSFPGHLGIGRKTAVDGLTLGVAPGEVFGLLGPNGAGKTTTLKMLLGLLRPDRGRVLLFGRAPREAAARARLGFLPENPYFYDYLTAGEFLDFYGRLRRLPAATRRTTARAALERVGLRDHEGVPLRKFSKGMIQRLGLAQAIQHGPDLVILDEPMSGLDPIGRREVRDLILELRAAGTTVFFSSHILQDAEMLCDRVAILVAGKLRAEGRLADLVSRRIRAYEVEVVGDLPSPLEAAIVSVQGAEALVRVDAPERLPHVLRSLEQAGCRVESVVPRRETLEDVFLAEVGRARSPGEDR